VDEIFNRSKSNFSQGSVINTSEIAREAHINRDTAENYFSIIQKI